MRERNQIRKERVKCEVGTLPVLAILQTLKIILVMILDELLSSGGFLPRDWRRNGDVGAGVKVAGGAIVVLQVNGAESNRSIVTVHYSDRRSERDLTIDDEVCAVIKETRGT